MANHDHAPIESTQNDTCSQTVKVNYLVKSKYPRERGLSQLLDIHIMRVRFMTVKPA